MSRAHATRLLVALSAAALVAVAAPRAAAQGTTTSSRATYITFSQPVSLPGITLPAGTYLFQHLNAGDPQLMSHRHVVQVFSKDRRKIYATFLTIPNQQLKPSGKPVVLFHETPASSPAAVQAWFYPGDTIGDEFVYPPHQARLIAQANHENVLSSPAVPEAAQSGSANESTTQEEEALERAPVSRVGENQTMAQNTAPPPNPNTATPEQPTSQPPDQNRPPAPNPNASQPPTPGAARTLPQTASSLWLFGLIAVLAPIGAFGLRRLRLSR